MLGYRFVVAANEERVREARREDVSLLQRSELPRGLCVKLNVIQSVGGRVGCLVVHIRTEQAVLVGKPVVDTTGKKVLADDLLSGESECPEISVSGDILGLGQRVKGEIRLR